jgi:soluble lytic murein transglycosylase-like protein
MIEGISRVLQRINQIETSFANVPRVNPSRSFERVLKESQSLPQQNQKTELAPKVNSVKAEIIKKAAAEKKEKTAKESVSDAPADVDSIIKESAAKYGVDESLVRAIAKNESNYRTDAVSPAGAIGVMQLMPATAEGLGVKDIYNPYDNIDGGTKYLKELLDTFGGDITKTVAAYNAGPQAVKAYGGVPPYAETQNYVERVLEDYK